MKIIGISGKKQSGKSYMAEVLQSLLQQSSCRIIRFADPLKEMVLECFVPSTFGWDVSSLDDDWVKNQVLPCGKTTRQLLQMVGTDWFRSGWDRCWINAYDARVEKARREGVGYVITPDVRFPNEVEYIQAKGGCVIRLLRAPFAHQDSHESETVLDPAEKATLFNWDSHAGVGKMWDCCRTYFNGSLVESFRAFMDYRRWKKYPICFDKVHNNRFLSMEAQTRWIKDNYPYIMGDLLPLCP